MSEKKSAPMLFAGEFFAGLEFFIDEEGDYNPIVRFYDAESCDCEFSISLSPVPQYQVASFAYSFYALLPNYIMPSAYEISVIHHDDDIPDQTFSLESLYTLKEEMEEAFKESST